MQTDYIEIQLPEGSNLTKRPMTDLQQRRLLCDDLYWLIQQDKDIAEELIDEYVYLLNDKRVDELTALCNNEIEWVN